MVKQIKANGVTIRLIKAKHLIRTEINREPDQERVLRIKAALCWQCVGVFTVMRCTGGGCKYWVVDAGNRFAAIKLEYPDLMKNGADLEIPCVILPADSDPCDMFIKLNSNVKAVNANQRFRARLVAGKKPETTIAQTLKNNNVELVFGTGRPAEGTTKCAAAWLELYQTLGKNGFITIVSMMADVWGRPDQKTIETAAISSNFVYGLAEYYRLSSYTLTRTTSKLLALDESAADIVYHAQSEFNPDHNGWKRRTAIRYYLADRIGGISVPWSVAA